MFKDLMIRFFLTKLDAQLDAYVAEQDAKGREIQNQIDALQADKAQTELAATKASRLRQGVHNLTND